VTRLAAYDYAWPGAYFVTIVVKDRMPLFGRIGADASHELTDAGHMVTNAWLATAESIAWSEADEFIVMPDHIHGIVTLGHDVSARQPVSLAAFIQRFKSYTTHAYGIGVREHGWIPYAGKLWQMNYHDPVIRNDRERDALRAYILDNPRRWAEKQMSTS
jgi:REP element-mobilizing transposase RayT